MTTKPKRKLDGLRVRDFFSQEVEAILATYRQFETLVSDESKSGSKNPAEDGKSVESLLRSSLRKFLPKNLEVASGFVLKPAVKTSVNNKNRKGKQDVASNQLDILVFDRAHYPIFNSFEDVYVVPPECVIGIISVKKTLRSRDIPKECESLLKVAKLCRTRGHNNTPLRGPFLGIIGIDSEKPVPKRTDTMRKRTFRKIKFAYQEKPYFDEVVGFVGVIGQYGAFKVRPNNNCKEAKFVWFDYSEDEKHFALQFLITGILSVYYDPTRNRNELRRPGFTSFPSGRGPDEVKESVPVEGLRCDSD